jgi:hypothetical protein
MSEKDEQRAQDEELRESSEKEQTDEETPDVEGHKRFAPVSQKGRGHKARKRF